MMPWLIRELKRFVKWVVILIGGLIALLVAVWFLTPHMDELGRRLDKERKEEARAKQQANKEGWQRWWDEHQTVDNGGKQPSNKGKPRPPAAPGYDNGFKAGYIAGYSAAAGGAVKPTGAEVDALARGQATKQNVSGGERSAWTMGFSAGWPFGWSKGN